MVQRTGLILGILSWEKETESETERGTDEATIPQMKLHGILPFTCNSRIYRKETLHAETNGG